MPAGALFVLGVLAGGAAAPLAAADLFLRDLQGAVGRQDRRAVAALFEYPATVLTSGARIPVLNAAALVQIYDVAFPPEMQGVISLAGVARPGEPPPVYRVTVAGGGLSLGKSWLWARFDGRRYRISRMIVPSGWVAIGAARVEGPERIVLRSGQASALFSRTLNPYEVRSYVLWAAKGQRLDIRINGFAARDILMRVVDPKTGGLPAYVETQTPPGARVWTGRLLESGEVRIDLLRTLPEGKPPPMYVLAVGLK